MRIAHVSATFPPYRGGTGNVCYHNALGLARRGHEVTVFTAATAGAPDHERRDGLRVERLRPLLRLGNASLQPGLLRALRGFDIIHLHCPFIAGAELTSLAALLYRTPLVLTYHNDLIKNGSWRDLVFTGATLTSRYGVFYRAQRVLFVSQGHAETSAQSVVYRRRRQACSILPNGVDATLFAPADDRLETRGQLGLAREAPLIGFFGGLDSAHHYKGLNILLEALASLPLAGAMLLVVGDGDLLERYRQQARSLGLADRVHFAGSRPQEALPPLYRACDVVALPSLVAESFGLVVVEALACGIPVVASDGPGVRTIMRDGEHGRLVNANDVAALGQALSQLLAEPDRAARMGAAGRAHARRTTTGRRSAPGLSRSIRR
jgi:glycosyltransferase involved in cell wall biosynthesis